MKEPFALDQFVIHHITDSNQWHLPFFGVLQLPGFLTIQKLMVLIGAALMLIVFCGLYRKNDRVPKGLTNFLEVIILHIRNDLLFEFIGEEDGRRLVPFFCTLFFFILFLNFLGLIPIFPTTPTANVFMTGALAFLILVFLTVGGIAKHGLLKYFTMFAPAGVPKPILIFIMPLEIISTIVIKPGALMIRLFANMFAGHIIILSILGLLIVFGWLAALPAILGALFVYLLEILVATLQAYIFTFLSIVFIGQIYRPQH